MPIQIVNARMNNLKSVSLTLEDGSLVAFTGVSGSGKSSLAVDVIFAEAQRDYLEGLSSYIGRFLLRSRRPDADAIEGLSPAILLNQRPLGRHPRSTVGTATDMYASFRLLFSRAGSPALPASMFSFNRPDGACEVCRGLGVEVEVNLRALLDPRLTLKQGAIRHPLFRVDGKTWSVMAATGLLPLDKPLEYFSSAEMEVLLRSPPVTVKAGHIDRNLFMGVETLLLRRLRDSRGLDARETDAAFLIDRSCRTCGGGRLNERARQVRWRGLSMADMTTSPLRDLPSLLEAATSPVEVAICAPLERNVARLLDLGVGYLSLNRSIATLSGGEAQRIKISRQLGSSLTDLIYVLDEPLASLHPTDCEPVIAAIEKLRDKGNTVLVIEHHRDLLNRVDRVVELGPAAGGKGGYIVTDLPPAKLAEGTSRLAEYLRSGRIDIPQAPRPAPTDWIAIENATLNNLAGVSFRFPRNLLTCITGVSGAGKSSLLQAIGEACPETVHVDQEPPGRSSRSTVATYCNAMAAIRAIFAQGTGKPQAWFSFNSEGACPQCNGLGQEDLGEVFLDDVHLICGACNGMRFRPEVIACRLEGLTIADVLSLTVAEAMEVRLLVKARRSLKPLLRLGLGYLTLGQPLTTLSGGEAQRLKLSEALTTGGSLFALDEPARGLGASDIANLIGALEDIVTAGNTVVVAEHNPAVMERADWLIDIGPGAGDRGGCIMAQSPPREIALIGTGATADVLRRQFSARSNWPGTPI